MSSQRKVEANRRNAGRSTGPRTLAGKARSKLNSRRHGLAVKLVADSDVGPEVHALAAALAGQNPEPVRLHFAMMAAAAEIELLRVNEARYQLFRSTPAPTALRVNPHIYGDVLSDLIRLERYERRAVSRRNRALRLL